MKKEKITLALLIIVLSAVLFIKCSDNPIKNDDKIDDKEVVVPQTNIPWSSLADSPWPMHHHDPQSTGRSKYAGPQSGTITKKINVGEIESGISIGYNQTIYLGNSTFPDNFYALDYEGNVKWKTLLYDYYGTPLVGSDSSINVASSWKIISYKNNGDTLWQNPLDENNKTVSIGLNIDKEGNLYYINYFNTLVVLDKKGKLKWELKDERFLNWVDAAPTFSPDGNTLYVQGINVSVLAIDIKSKSVKWIFGNQNQISSPVVDNAGNIFIIPSGFDEYNIPRKLYSLNPAGEVNWEFEFDANYLFDNTEPTIDYNGNIYFGSDTLYSVTNNGKLKWKVDLKSKIVSPLICDINNTIYIGTQNGTTGENKIIAVDNSGEILWIISDTEERTLGVSPALSEDGTLFYPTWRSKNYLIIK